MALNEHLEEGFNGEHIGLEAVKPGVSHLCNWPTGSDHLSVTYIGMDLAGEEMLKGFLSSLCLPDCHFPATHYMDTGSLLLHLCSVGSCLHNMVHQLHLTIHLTCPFQTRKSLSLKQSLLVCLLLLVSSGSVNSNNTLLRSSCRNSSEVSSCFIYEFQLYYSGYLVISMLLSFV